MFIPFNVIVFTNYSLRGNPMQSKLLTCVLTGVFLTALSNVTVNNSASAQGTTFECSIINGVPTTIARTAQKQVPVIRWVSDFGSEAGFTPERRCKEVSQKFQEYYSQGKLNFLTTGRKNGQNIVCVADTQGGNCTGQLFTLKPGANPGETLKNLLNVRTGAGGPLNETNDRVYVDMNQYLRDAIALAIDPSTDLSTPSNPPSNQAASEPKPNPLPTQPQPNPLESPNLQPVNPQPVNPEPVNPQPTNSPPPTVESAPLW
jgi:hypothetical protein